MNKQKTFRRQMMALVMGGMILAMNQGTTTLAAPPAQVLTIEKTFTKEEKTQTPTVDFTFKATPIPATIPAGGDQKEIKPGPVGGIKTLPTISYTAADTGTDIVKTGNLELDETKFTAPGIYRYVIEENNGGYEGITYSTVKKNFDVYVDQNNDIISYAFSNDLGTEKTDGKFTNDYGKDNDTIHDLTVTKEVTGNQGDKNKLFDFSVKVDGAAGEKYTVEVKEDANAAVNTITLETGTAQTVKLKDGGSIHIWGLSDTDKVTVDETDYAAEGYTTTGELTGLMVTADNTQKTITNDKEVSALTGIVTDMAPYVLLIAVAGGLLVLSMRRKESR
ncbi:MAG: FctA domain-containing protein [Eubacteriales bacterium]|nr:FctA domain-containing protein [Eubacteriales bacterium]